MPNTELETDEHFTALRQMQEEIWKMLRESDRKFDKLGEKLDRVTDTLERFLEGLQKPNGNQ